MSDYMTLVFQHFRPRMERIPIRTDEELASLAMPVQLILGGNDALIRSNETRDRMARLVARLNLAYLEHEGHILPRQTAAISEFVRAEMSVGNGLQTVPTRDALPPGTV
jgi:pimeloyl-ACP methyl ester carboxylesterase